MCGRLSATEREPSDQVVTNARIGPWVAFFHEFSIQACHIVAALLPALKKEGKVGIKPTHVAATLGCGKCVSSYQRWTVARETPICRARALCVSDSAVCWKVCSIFGRVKPKASHPAHPSKCLEAAGKRAWMRRGRPLLKHKEPKRCQKYHELMTFIPGPKSVPPSAHPALPAPLSPP